MIILKNTNQKLQRAFDEYIGPEPLVKHEDKNKFINYLEKKPNGKRNYWIPNLLTAMVLIGLAAALYGFYQNERDSNLGLAARYETIDEIFNNAKLVIKGEVLEGSVEFERALDFQVIKEIQYYVKVEEVIQNESNSFVETGDVITLAVAKEASINGQNVNLEEFAINSANYLLFLNPIENEELVFVNNSPQHLYQQQGDRFKNIRSNALKIIENEDLEAYKNNRDLLNEEEKNEPEEFPVLADLLDHNPKYQLLYEQLNTQLLELPNADGLFAKASSEAAILYLHGMLKGKIYLAKKYIQVPDEPRTEWQIEQNMKFYNKVKDYDVEVVEIESSLGEPVYYIGFQYTNGKETLHRIVLLEAWEINRLTFHETGALTPVSYNGLGDLNKEYVMENHEIGITKENVEALFGRPAKSEVISNKEVWLFDRMEDHYYKRNLDGPALNEFLSGNVSYQLFITFENNQASNFSYYYKGEDGKVWLYEVTSDLAVHDNPYNQ